LADGLGDFCLAGKIIELTAAQNHPIEESSSSGTKTAPALLAIGFALVVVGFLVIALSTLQIALPSGTVYLVGGGVLFALGVALLAWSWKIYS
jgi:hypothetical protein